MGKAGTERADIDSLPFYRERQRFRQGDDIGLRRSVVAIAAAGDRDSRVDGARVDANTRR